LKHESVLGFQAQDIDGLNTSFLPYYRARLVSQGDSRREYLQNTDIHTDTVLAIIYSIHTILI
jgi:hypothetical protein